MGAGISRGEWDDNLGNVQAAALKRQQEEDRNLQSVENSESGGEEDGSQARKGGFLKRRLATQLDKKIENVKNDTVVTSNLPDFIKRDNTMKPKDKHKELLAGQINSIKGSILKNRKARKAFNFIRGTALYKEIVGIKMNVIDEGGKPIYDAEGNVVDKSEPLLEMVHSQDQRLLLSMGIKTVMKEYLIEIDDLKQIWMGFLSMDVKNRGYVTLNHLMNFLSERQYGVVAPFLERFFTLIDRGYDDKFSFDEFFPALCAFSLFTRQEMLGFIFSMLDKDRDKVISKKDLLEFASKQRGGKKRKRDYIKLYPPNVTVAIQLHKFARGDKITQMEFFECGQRTPYFVFPAFRLQDELQEMFGGIPLWNRVKKRIEDQEKQLRIQRLKENFVKRIEEKQKKIYDKHYANYLKLIEQYNEKYYKRQKLIRNRMRYIRIPKRRSSDCAIVLRKYFEYFYEPYETLKQKKKIAKENYSTMDILPQFRGKFFHSMIWEKYNLKQVDEVNLHQKIFRVKKVAAEAESKSFQITSDSDDDEMEVLSRPTRRNDVLTDSEAEAASQDPQDIVTEYKDSEPSSIDRQSSIRGASERGSQKVDHDLVKIGEGLVDDISAEQKQVQDDHMFSKYDEDLEMGDDKLDQQLEEFANLESHSMSAYKEASTFQIKLNKMEKVSEASKQIDSVRERGSQEILNKKLKIKKIKLKKRTSGLPLHPTSSKRSADQEISEVKEVEEAPAGNEESPEVSPIGSQHDLIVDQTRESRGSKRSSLSKKSRGSCRSHGSRRSIGSRQSGVSRVASSIIQSSQPESQETASKKGDPFAEEPQTVVSVKHFDATATIKSGTSKKSLLPPLATKGLQKSIPGENSRRNLGATQDLEKQIHSVYSGQLNQSGRTQLQQSLKSKQGQPALNASYSLNNLSQLQKDFKGDAASEIGQTQKSIHQSQHQLPNNNLNISQWTGMSKMSQALRQAAAGAAEEEAPGTTPGALFKQLRPKKGRKGGDKVQRIKIPKRTSSHESDGSQKSGLLGEEMDKSKNFSIGTSVFKEFGVTSMASQPVNEGKKPGTGEVKKEEEKVENSIEQIDDQALGKKQVFLGSTVQMSQIQAAMLKQSVPQQTPLAKKKIVPGEKVEGQLDNPEQTMKKDQLLNIGSLLLKKRQARDQLMSTPQLMRQGSASRLEQTPPSVGVLAASGKHQIHNSIGRGGSGSASQMLMKRLGSGKSQSSLPQIK